MCHGSNEIPLRKERDFNFKIMEATESFDEHFCFILEYYLTSVLEEPNDKQIRSLWCDGILMPYIEIQLTKKSVNDTRKIETKAWIGQGPSKQCLFDLILRFGKYSLRRYAKGNNLKDCLPGSENISVDFENKRMELFMR